MARPTHALLIRIGAGALGLAAILSSSAVAATAVTAAAPSHAVRHQAVTLAVGCSGTVDWNSIITGNVCPSTPTTS